MGQSLNPRESGWHEFSSPAAGGSAAWGLPLWRLRGLDTHASVGPHLYASGVTVWGTQQKQGKPPGKGREEIARHSAVKAVHGV